MACLKEMNQNQSKTTIPNPRAKEFSLGGTPLESVSRPRPRSRRVFLPLTGFVLVLVILLAGGSLLVGARFTQSLHFENRELSLFSGLRIIGDSLLGTGQALAGENDGRVNILLLGRAGEKYPGRNLTDTVMLLSLDMEKKRVGLLSLPRDLFAPIAGTGLSTKLNSLYQIGLNDGSGGEVLRESVAEITGLPIHYYAMIDFDGFERMIDALGGIQVEVKRDIYDPRYPGKNYSHETFALSKGWQKLDGQTALKYARERHDDPEGDFGRTKRQQDIMQAVRDRAWSLPTFLNPFALSGFLESLGKSITTDIPPEELGRFIELTRGFDTKNISTVVVDAWKKESLLRVSHVETGAGRAFILVPRSGNWDEIHDVALHLFEEHDRERRQEEIKNEAANLLILTSGRYRNAAEALAADIRETFPLASVKIETMNTLAVSDGTAIIQDKSGVRTPFTLSGLMARYGLSIGEVPVGATSSKSEADIVVLYQKNDISELFTLDRAAVPVSEADFQEPLAPQKNPYLR